MQHLACAFALLVALAVLGPDPRTAEAAIYYVATGGNDGNPGTESSPFRNPQACVDAMSAGDTCIVQPGTYTGNVTISAKSGTVANPITLKAQNFAVNCADPDNDPDGCLINTSNRSILNFGLTLNNSDNWVFEGLDINTFRIDDSNNGAFRFGYLDGGSTPGSGSSIQINRSDNWLIEHIYGNVLVDDGHDYGVSAFWANNLTVNNAYFAGNYNHGISIKRGGVGFTFNRIVCEGADAHCIILGQEEDDTAFFSSSPTSCPNTTTDDGSTMNITDQTAQDVTITNLFTRDVTNADVRTRAALMVDNVRDVTVLNLFGKTGNNNAAVPIWVRNLGTASQPGGRCGIERGNILIRGAVLIATDAVLGCILMSSLGESPADVTLENVVCHDGNGSSGGDPGITFATGPLNFGSGAWETNKAPATTIRNSVFNDCTVALGSTGNAISVTQDHNAVFNCGTLSGTGNQTADPQFVGPESVPVPTLDAAYFAAGARLWDWAGRYQPIIDRFRTQNAALENAGTGTAAPCTGSACDIGANEFFDGEIVIPPEVWASCAVYGNGDQVFGSFTNPWIDGRSGLVVDVDCAQKRIVVGRCDDPNDEATCDTDIYIHKAAQLRKRRVNEPIMLSPGTTGSDADTSGVCWRTRAIFDFAESLEELTGIWVRYEVDPNGGTHTCASPSGSVEWAWQGAE